ncbi:MAG TPA: cob(I)yrinic acid a,c-diamide adenosyltransferase, partial [Acidimicrobiales bacterium]|nr:cob(I)yrinic acid a,c-diamide adenosyltransferase [Acidimicrobiales bacterium]
SVSGLAALVAFYGLVEFLSGNHGIFGWKENAPTRLRGTLVNPDHFASYLGMVIPLMMAYLIASGAGRRGRRRARSDKESSRAGAPASHADPGSGRPTFSLFERERSKGPWERESRQLIFGFGCALCIVALVFTFSRGGIVSFLLGGLFFVALLWIREPGHRRRLAAIGIALAAMAIITWIGAEPVLERFGALERETIVRTRLYRDTLAMARDFPILGSGLGTFERVFPRYASPEFTFTTRVSHAHSEPLQLAAEGGVVAVLIVAFALVTLFRDLLLSRLLGLLPSSSTFDIRHSRLSPSSGHPDGSSIPHPAPPGVSPAPRFGSVRHDPYNIALAFGCLSSLVVISVHSLFDFPLRIPANGILLSALLGIAVVAVGMRFRADGTEPLLPACVVHLSRRGRLALVLGAGALSLFMGGTAVTSGLAEELGNRGYEIIAGTPGSVGGSDKPWVVETARNREALDKLRLAVRLDPLSADGQYRLGRLHEQLALRAWNAGLDVAVFQFVKSAKWKVGEEAAFAQLGELHDRHGIGGAVEWHKMGAGWSWSRKAGGELDHAAAAADGWAEISRRLAAQRHDFYVLDEFTYPLKWGWVDVDDVVDALLARPGQQHVVITGRDAPPRLVEVADLVTEMTKVKHPMDAGRKGQKGIEW